MRKNVVRCLFSALISLTFLTSLKLQNGPSSTIYAQGSLPAVPQAETGAHPRLLITDAYLDEILRPRVEANGETWQALEAYIDGSQITSDLAWTPGTVIRSLAVAWLVTQEPRYRTQALQGLQQLVNLIEGSPVMQQPDSQWDPPFLDQVAELAVAYDWLHAALSPADRGALADTLLRAVRRLQDPTTDNGRVWVQAGAVDGNAVTGEYLLQSWSDEDARWLWAITAAGLALQGEHPDADFLVAYARNLWTQTALPALDLQPNGAWAEGPVYGFTAIWAKAQTALAWWTARGENYFDDTAWWLDRLAYDIFLRYPGVQRVANRADGDLIAGYPSIIGDGERYHRNAAYGRAQDLLLRTVFAGTPYANWMDWIAAATPPAPDWLRVEEFLWRDPFAAGEPPDRLTWRAFGTNHVFMRSNWTDENGLLDPGATYISFQAGDHFAARQFFDQGGFTLWRAGDDLAVRSGVYSGKGTAWHDANYYGRTVAANTLLICDLGETFDGIRPNLDTPEIWLNDCGQRPTGPAGYGPINPDTWQANRQLYETGNILRILDIDDGSATYLLADITAAYNSTQVVSPGNRPKVSAALRELVYLRPGTLIIHDRVMTVQSQLTTINTIHFNGRPEQQGGWQRVSGINSALYLQQLAPVASTEIVEGYVVAGETVDTAWGEPVTNEYEQTPYGMFRLDTFAAEGSTTPWFLTVLVAQDITAPAPIPSIYVEADGLRGAVISTAAARWQLMFDDDPGDITQARLTIWSGVQKLLLTGLVPQGVYSLRWADGAQTRGAADGAGTLLLSSPVPGDFEFRLRD